ncbi:hypothetical protein NEFER01_1800 [Nematocida sp. LUAm1]|nr:hypothetical protein NEFER02_1797 [Nematocida sp. LUAm2]KAI5178681.1 hypothetical protein NEFER01_1800 [Nematocida sp. LUAm1]
MYKDSILLKEWGPVPVIPEFGRRKKQFLYGLLRGASCGLRYEVLLLSNIRDKKRYKEKILIEKSIEMDDLGLRILLDGKTIRFTSSKHYYYFREVLLYLHQGNSLIEGVEIKEDRSSRLVVLEKLFNLEAWKGGIEINNLDIFLSNRKTIGVMDIIGGKIMDRTNRETHCGEREYINIQYFLRDIWWREERKLISEEAGKEEIFHIFIFDCFYKYTGKCFSSFNQCKFQENTECLCSALNIGNSQNIAYLNTKTPSLYIFEKKRILSFLIKEFYILEEFYSFYLEKYPKVEERMKNFFLLFTRDKELFYSFVSSEGNSSIERFFSVPEETWRKYLIDRVGVRITEHTESSETQDIDNTDLYAKCWKEVPGSPNVFFMRLDTIYLVEFLPQTATDLFFLLYELSNYVFQDIHSIGIEMYEKPYYIMQFSILSKYLLSTHYNITFSLLYLDSTDWPLRAMQDLFSKKESSSESNLSLSFVTSFLFSLYVSSTLSYSPDLIIWSTWLYAFSKKRDVLAFYSAIRHISKISPQFKKFFPREDLNTWIKKSVRALSSDVHSEEPSKRGNRILLLRHYNFILLRNSYLGLLPGIFSLFLFSLSFSMYPNNPMPPLKRVIFLRVPTSLISYKNSLLFQKYKGMLTHKDILYIHMYTCCFFYASLSTQKPPNSSKDALNTYILYKKTFLRRINIFPMISLYSSAVPPGATEYLAETRRFYNSIKKSKELDTHKKMVFLLENSLCTYGLFYKALRHSLKQEKIYMPSLFKGFSKIYKAFDPLVFLLKMQYRDIYAEYIEISKILLPKPHDMLKNLLSFIQTNKVSSSVSKAYAHRALYIYFHFSLILQEEFPSTLLSKSFISAACDEDTIIKEFSRFSDATMDTDAFHSMCYLYHPRLFKK